MKRKEMDREMMKINKDMHQERTRMENKGGERWRRFLCYEPHLLFFFKLKASQVLPVRQSYIHEHPEQRTLGHPHTQALKPIYVSSCIIQDAISVIQ